MNTVESLGFISGVYAPIMQQLLQKDAVLHDFHSGIATCTLTQKVAQKRAASFSMHQREILVNALKKQYEHLQPDSDTITSLERLAHPNAVTIVTGHQLNIFTGPLFFWYKILDVINMTEKLQKADTTHHYIPVFWMASEDHDVEEINHFYLGEQKFRWDSPKGGPVGRMSTETFQECYARLEAYWKNKPNGVEVLKLFKNSYLEEDTLANATRKLVHLLFGAYGLLIVDGDDSLLKSLFVPTLKKELNEQTTYQEVSKTDKLLAQRLNGYSPQVNPREINIFYLLDNKRVRIIQKTDDYTTSDGAKIWSKEVLEKEMDQHPERFSPNALMRPLYQECILPNVSYVGGGGELAYWLQLKSTFKAFGIPYPLLAHRSTVLMITEKQLKKCSNLSVSLEDLFLPKASFINKRVRQISDIDIDFTPQQEVLIQQFESLRKLAEQTDASFLGAVEAQEKKQLKGLAHLEKRLLKAQRLKLQDQVIRMTDLRHVLFPHGKLQERVAHFSGFLDNMTIPKFTKSLKNCLEVFSEGTVVIRYSSVVKN